MLRISALVSLLNKQLNIDDILLFHLFLLAWLLVGKINLKPRS